MRCRFRCWCPLVCVALALSFASSVASPVPAQPSSSGAIRGYVRDSRGAVIADVAITATSPDMAGPRETSSTVTGAYRLGDLPPGKYTVTAEREGFASCVRQGIRIDAGRTLGLDLTLRQLNADVLSTLQLGALRFRVVGVTEATLV